MCRSLAANCSALQAIEPSTAAHYYDFTVGSGADEWAGQPFFTSPEWFGPLGTAASAAGGLEEGELRGGHFSGLLVPRNRSAPTTNSWGVVTEPYSQNDARFLTRAASICGLPTTSLPLPGCGELLETPSTGRLHGHTNVCGDVF